MPKYTELSSNSWEETINLWYNLFTKIRKKQNQKKKEEKKETLVQNHFFSLHTIFFWKGWNHKLNETKNKQKNKKEKSLLLFMNKAEENCKK